MHLLHSLPGFEAAFPPAPVSPCQLRPLCAEPWAGHWGQGDNRSLVLALPRAHGQLGETDVEGGHQAGSPEGHWGQGTYRL